MTVGCEHVRLGIYWAKAQENLETAKWASENGKPNAAVSRAYYAVFQAQVAVLIKLTNYQKSGKSYDHGQVQAEFNVRLVHRRKVLPSKFSSINTDLIKLRHEADYDNVSISAVVASRAIARVDDFLKTVSEKLKD